MSPSGHCVNAQKMLAVGAFQVFGLGNSACDSHHTLRAHSVRPSILDPQPTVRAIPQEQVRLWRTGATWLSPREENADTPWTPVHTRAVAAAAAAVTCLVLANCCAALSSSLGCTLRMLWCGSLHTTAWHCSPQASWSLEGACGSPPRAGAHLPALDLPKRLDLSKQAAVTPQHFGDRMVPPSLDLTCSCLSVNVSL